VHALLYLLQVLHMLNVCFMCVARVLQCVAVCCGILQWVAVRCIYVAAMCVEVCCSVLQYVAVCRCVSQSAYI